MCRRAAVRTPIRSSLIQRTRTTSTSTCPAPRRCVRPPSCRDVSPTRTIRPRHSSASRSFVCRSRIRTRRRSSVTHASLPIIRAVPSMDWYQFLGTPNQRLTSRRRRRHARHGRVVLAARRERVALAPVVHRRACRASRSVMTSRCIRRSGLRAAPVPAWACCSTSATWPIRCASPPSPIPTSPSGTRRPSTTTARRSSSLMNGAAVRSRAAGRRTRWSGARTRSSRSRTTG
jgi:hypothetical protein